jgi:catechol 2,3-dioxygenase-like lactoylglutathione lyase family enzyme
VNKITINLMVTNMRESLDFYCGVLDFTLSMGVNADHETFTDGVLRDDLIFVMLTHGAEELMLQRRDSLAQDVPVFAADATPGGTFTLYMRGEPADALAARLPDSVEIIKGPETTWYGMRELYIRDPNGYVLTFGAPDGPPPV